MTPRDLSNKVWRLILKQNVRQLMICPLENLLVILQLSVTCWFPNSHLLTNSFFLSKMADNYSSKEQDLISNLPNEVLVHILKNLDYCHFLAVRHVSTRFNTLSNYFVLTQRMINKQELFSFSYNPLSFHFSPKDWVALLYQLL